MAEGNLSLAGQRGVQGGVLGTRTRPTPHLLFVSSQRIFAGSQRESTVKTVKSLIVEKDVESCSVSVTTAVC